MFLIIHNPLSNNKRSKRKTKRIINFFKKHNIPFKLKSTFRIDDLNKYLKSHAQITDILYLGGDGSINYLINHVNVSSIKQTIYLEKSGSGNDFFRSLARIKKGNITIGTAKTNNGDYKFINGAGIGIDSLITHYVNNDEKKNKLSYFLHFFRAIIKFNRLDYDITVDGVNQTFKKGYLVAVQNGKYFGGGMKVSNKASITDDDFIIIVAHDLNNFLIQLLFITIYFGAHRYFKKWITFLKGKEIKIKIKDKYYMQVDGEVAEKINEIVITKTESKEFIAFNKKLFKNEISKKFHSN